MDSPLIRFTLVIMYMVYTEQAQRWAEQYVVILVIMDIVYTIFNQSFTGERL